MGLPHNPEESLPLFPDGFRGGVRHIIQNNDGRILHPGNELCHFQIQLGIATETQVNHFPVHGAGEDGRMRHAGTGGAAALQDAGAVHHDGPVGLGGIGKRRQHRIALGYADFQEIQAVVQRKIEHVFTHQGIHVRHQFALMVFLVGAVPVEAAAYKTPLAVKEGIQVQAAAAGVGHVGHMVASVGPAGVHGRGIRAETHIQAGRIQAQPPKGSTANLLIVGRETLVSARRCLNGLAIQRQILGVGILDILGIKADAGGQKKHGENQWFHKRTNV